MNLPAGSSIGDENRFPWNSHTTCASDEFDLMFAIECLIHGHFSFCLSTYTA